MMLGSESPFDILTCARPNILALQPYRCARDDYKDDGTNILLDANENAYGPSLDIQDVAKSMNGGTKHKGRDPMAVDLLGLNRYPDPHQVALKRSLCSLRNTHDHTSDTLEPDNLFVGVGSDEVCMTTMFLYPRERQDSHVSPHLWHVCCKRPSQ